MNRTIVLLILLALLSAGCQPTRATQPTPSMTSAPVVPATSAPPQGSTVPSAPRAVSGLSIATHSGSLESLSIENAAGIGFLAQVGEDAFIDHIAVSPDGSHLAVTTRGGVLLVDAAGGQRLDFYPSPGV